MAIFAVMLFLTFFGMVAPSYAASSNANLSMISLLQGQLSPGFASGITSYTVSVPSGVSATKVGVFAADATATIKVKGTTVVSGAESGIINLAVGANPIDIVVTSQDLSTTMTYTVTYNRAAPINANLTTLRLSSGLPSPSFVATTTSYTATVANAVSSITVTPTVEDSTSTVTVNSVLVTSGSSSGAIPLVEGSNTITAVVTAQGGTTRTYTVTVTRSAPPPPSSDAALTGIGLSAAGMSPTLSAINAPLISLE
ncbi:cadherin-like beta sandwich domain-containing protein [Rhizobium sp. PL01]|uniref:cadherin-like beta sandwich domain-containing protein n=1 Tax=Rhizobium sp. PL01 TaxID=3085631 RepID=UPI002982AB21|nr:cadherin-like beta sandwich domain-containing protein [Rhizobium sp. PL01]MDW5318239.1 cadherin-like beta sandwich domain-containing protein [Rhizobium sp. PL01]